MTLSTSSLKLHVYYKTKTHVQGGCLHRSVYLKRKEKKVPLTPKTRSRSVWRFIACLQIIQWTTLMVTICGFVCYDYTRNYHNKLGNFRWSLHSYIYTLQD